MPGLEAVNLGVMEAPEARALLLKIAPRIGSEADALAETCGRLPLALRLAASYLQVNEHTDPADYVRQLRQSRQRLQLLDRARELTAEDLGLEASFTLSFQQLPPAQQQRFTQLAVFPISFDCTAVTAVWGIEECAASDALDGLLQLSLLEWNPQTQRFELHDLLREFARNHAKPEELDAAKRRHAEHFIHVALLANGLYQKGRESVLAGLALFDRERGHLEVAFDWLESRGDEESAPLLVSLVDAVVYTSALRFHPSQHIRWLEAQAKAARIAGHRQGEATALGNLGRAYDDLGDVRKAIEFLEQALVIAREIGDRRGEGQDLGNLGIAYAALGDARKAVEFHEQALGILREIGDRHGEGNTLGNLGNACAGLGNARKAIEFYEQALVIAREIGDRRGEGNSLGNLGNAFYRLGETRKGIGFYEQALVIAREMGDRQGQGNAIGNLGNAYKKLGDVRKALEFYEQALAIARETGDRRGEGSDLWNSALALEKLGDRAQAIARGEAALRIYEAIEDPHAAMVRARLAEWRKAGPGL